MGVSPGMLPDLHVVYCLTSSGGDLYEAMTRVSLATVRLTNPSARVTIACDQQTHQALQASGSQLFHEADAVRGFPTPDGPPTYRNRYVKTQLGRLIDGPFLFLDSDTVVRKPLTPLLDLHCDIAAAPNHSRDTLAEQIWSEDQANLDAMGWQVREPYVNGGVIWYGGTAGASRFADTWHHNWINNVEQTGRYRDQPALNYSVLTSEANLKTLEHNWNAQVEVSPKQVVNARIWHLYLVWTDAPMYTLSKWLTKNSGHHRADPSEIVVALVTNRHPWPQRNIADQIIAQICIQSNSLGKISKEWFASRGPLHFCAHKALPRTRSWIQLLSRPSIRLRRLLVQDLFKPPWS